MIPKFRAWDKDEKVMRIVNEIHFTIKTITCEPLKGHDNMLEMYDPICFEGHFELMQSTGLKDKNGVKIFEGDIVKVSNHPFQKKEDSAGIEIDGNYLINWSEHSLTWLAGDLLLHQLKPYIEVIGNIYENPELLNLR